MPSHDEHPLLRGVHSPGTRPTETEQDPTVDAPVEDPRTDPTEEPSDAGDGADDTEHETFDRAYVAKLRKEAAGYREKAKDRDALAAALWTARVTATGRLADPTDLAMPDDADPLDAEAVTAAVEELLASKPHLTARTPRGDVGAGATPVSETVDLAGLFRSRA